MANDNEQRPERKDEPNQPSKDDAQWLAEIPDLPWFLKPQAV